MTRATKQREAAKTPQDWAYYPNWLYCVRIPQCVSSVRSHTIDGVSEEELACQKSLKYVIPRL